MLLGYLLIFCRAALGLLFALSFFGKAPNLPPFERTISSFGILPERFNRLAAFSFLIGELAVILFMALGGSFLGVGFGLAALLLIIFSVALSSALARRLQTTCNSLGLTEKPLSHYDLWRNAGFIGCALVGVAALRLTGQGPLNLNLVEGIVVGLSAAVFVAAWTQIREIAQLGGKS